MEPGFEYLAEYSLCLHPFFTDPDWSGKEKHAAEHEAGRQALLLALKEACGLTLSQAELEEELEAGPHGKPRFKGREGLHFNISHSGDLAVCAVGRHALGVDAELVKASVPKHTRKILSEAEKNTLEALPEEERGAFFYGLWTLKESYVKATGVGVSVKLTELEFEECGPNRFALKGDAGARWRFDQIHRDPYVISLCRRSAGRTRGREQYE